MDNKISDVIVTLSSLYELLLNIGQSFDIEENAEGFLKTLMRQKNLSLAAYFTFEPPNRMIKAYSIPKIEIEQHTLATEFISSSTHNCFYILNKSHPSFKSFAQITKFPQNEFVVYFTGAKSILILGKKNTSFDEQDLIKSEQVLNKFGLFMESLESHHRIKDEIKIKEEQAEKLKKQNDDLIKYIRSNNELEQFAYRVSHDLKAPLNTIMAFSDLLSKSFSGNATDQQAKFLEFILDSGFQMKNLISGILDYSKINGEVLNLKKIYVHELIETIRNLLNHNLNENNGKIIVDKLPEFIIVDETKITQLFLNLISNALKFKKENINPEVTINGECNDKEVTFSVSDNGIGIPLESQDKIFDLFSKADNNDKVEGHGIGLNTCCQIISQHNGKIWVESEPGVGTTFYFTIQKMLLPF